MAFSYDAGSSTPDLGGLVEIGGIRINNGTFKLTSLGGLGSPPIRVPMTELASAQGSHLGTQFHSGYTAAIEGYIDVDQVAYLDPALDMLKAAISPLVNGPTQLLIFNRSGFATRRQVTASFGGQVTVEEPVERAKLVPQRNFVIPMAIPDPFAYNADSQHSVTVPYNGASVQLPNNGNAPTTFAVTFSGTATNPALFDDTTGQSIALTMAITTHPVTVQTNPVTGISAVDSVGTNDYANVSAFTLLTIPAGTSRMFHSTATGVSGGTCTVVYRDAWV